MKSLFVGCVLKIYFHKHIHQRKPLIEIKADLPVCHQ